MLAKEVQSIARSITKWTSRHMSADGLREWHQEQNKKSVKVRRVKARDKAEEIRAYYDSHPDVTREELSVIFDVSDFTLKGLSLGMAETRNQVRQTKATSKAEEIRAYKAEHPELSNRAIAKVLGIGRKTVDRALYESGT
jgi:predicted HTH transcriptional regulator